MEREGGRRTAPFAVLRAFRCAPGKKTGDRRQKTALFAALQETAPFAALRAFRCAPGDG